MLLQNSDQVIENESKNIDINRNENDDKDIQNQEKKHSKTHDDKQGIRKSHKKKKTSKMQQTAIRQINEQIIKPVPSNGQPLTEVKLGIMQKLKLLFLYVQITIKSYFDSVTKKIYSKSLKGEYKRRQYSMKFFPLDDVEMCLDEYIYKFERMDIKEGFNKKTENDEESDDEDDQEVLERQNDRAKYFQFWQWNYMFTDNNDKGQEKNMNKEPGEYQDEEEELSSEDDDDDDEEEDDDEEDDQMKNHLKIQTQFSIKLKDTKKEYIILKKDVKAIQKQFKINKKEIKKIENGTARLIDLHQKLREDYIELVKRNKMLLKHQKQVFEVKDSIQHVHLRQY
ncbi:hypothetical protein TTHERM_00217190 (macronuclear) [Tetrahymena thermophila SB210]|uniref:Uncharacterized protein n=1 Tax=Tetrahymena thermophila (strain SB210) TaxID=312017 RepID=I7LVW7_TETTS|nr:hypothetical protein TTHERM_00217190 [Tetrahymena thermophila SB210]EAS00245.2 hypothetical protein TTHERM_00217190 [Tetrahymena thermophila SB210]|eukprot:XP_001020490.2 hypothetical protein TTHERM_00217190 [Tetrahymena thermophila SB210]